MRVLGRKVVEREQLVSIIDQAFAGLWVFRLERVDEQIEGGMRILAGLGLPYVVQHFPGFGLGALGKVIEHIAALMHPAALLAGCRENVFQRRPEAHGTIARSQFWSLQAPAFEAEKYLAPALGAFPDAVFNGLKVLLSPCVDTDHDEHAKPIVGATQTTVNPVSPDIDPFVAAQVSLAPVIVFRRPLALEARDGVGGIR